MTSHLEPDEATLEAWMNAVSRLVIQHQLGTHGEPAMGAVGAAGHALAAQLSVPIEEHPLPGGIEAITLTLQEGSKAALNTTGGGYMAYVPGGGLFPAAMADLIAGTYNRFTGLAGAAPVFVRLEADVLRWLTTEFGYGDDARGLFTSGGSQANLSALITARHAHFGESGDYRTATVYTSAQAHHSIAKSVRLAGVPPSAMREVPVDERLRLCPEALDAAIRRDLAEGMSPWAVVAAAGTTNTGAIDPLDAIADVCAKHGVWLHIDGAYGGAFVLCPEGRALLNGIARADSITFDPHKGLFLPYGTGCLLVKDGRALRAAHGGDASYLQDFDTFGRSGEPPSPSDYGPELSRPYRGLRLWLPLMLFGAAAFREALSEKLTLARTLYDGLMAADADIELLDAPQLSAVAFRLRRRPSESGTAWDERNAAWLAATNAKQRVHLSSTRLPTGDGDAFTLRVCVLSFRTHAEHVDLCIHDLISSIPS